MKKLCNCETTQDAELLRIRDALIQVDAKLAHLLEAAKRVVSTPSPLNHTVIALRKAVEDCS